MLNRMMADAVVLFHFGFILFVLSGGLLVLKWKRVAWFHIPAFVWGVLVEYAGWWCPLTPLENRFREAAGEAAYQSGFIEHYILPVIYPSELTREIQIIFGSVVVLINAAVYGWIWYRKRLKRRESVS